MAKEITKQLIDDYEGPMNMPFGYNINDSMFYIVHGDFTEGLGFAVWGLGATNSKTGKKEQVAAEFGNELTAFVCSKELSTDGRVVKGDKLRELWMMMTSLSRKKEGVQQ